MSRFYHWVLTAAILLSVSLLPVMSTSASEVVRPEEIKSKRQIVYDDATYVKLARMWKEYNDAYPSEFAYANWMYAARYAGDKEYSDLLAEGMQKYPANPTLLYLKSMVKHGGHEDTESRTLLERAIAIDPTFADPWFSLVIHYMDARDDERLDLALRHLLENGAIADEIIDYNYNVLIGLEQNAILITNGDNDTYPAWILTRILDVRPDVTIVNRSLLNTEWYPMYLVEHDFPRFIGRSELDDLRSSIIREMEQKKASPPLGGPFGDTLVLRAIESANRAGRPVYFAKTIYLTDKLRSHAERGRDLGLVTLVTPSETAHPEQLRRLYTTWVDSFRTSALQSWHVRTAPKADAGQFMVTNYAFGIAKNLSLLKEKAPELRVRLFRWYKQYVEELLVEDCRSRVAYGWCCSATDVADVDTWCKKQGLKCGEAE
jgi:hypothetical protein